jgi:hypothetical protein
MELTSLPSDILRKIDSFLAPTCSIALRYSGPSLYADLKHRKQVDEKDNGYYYKNKKDGLYYMKSKTSQRDIMLTSGRLTFHKEIITQEYVRRRGEFGRLMYTNHIGKIIYTIYDVDYDFGSYAHVVSKDHFRLVEKAYNAYLVRKYHKKVRYELRERVEEAKREEQRKRPPAFVIKGNSKPTNPWKKL